MNAKHWLWSVAGFNATCVIGQVLVAGAGVYFVSHHIAVHTTTSAAALRQLDDARARFKNVDPLIEIDALEQPHVVHPLSTLPSSATHPDTLHMLAWDPDERRLARIALPFWVLRVGRRKMDLLPDAGVTFDELNLDVAELERIGPALVLDYRRPAGSRVLIWTQ
jgi:hypothetical protein